MAFDGLVTRAVVHELSMLVGARITRIHQPHPSDIVMQVRSTQGTLKLLISANPTYPRIHLTSEEFINPKEAPMFCMLLRKHCENGVIEAITQDGMERVIYVDLKSRDELGDTTRKRIVVEIMGRHSNIILLDVKTNMILDGIHHVSHGVSQYRQVLPGRAYVAPPAQNKLNPLTASEQDFVMSLQWNEGKLDKQLVERFSGLSPLIARELVSRAALPTRDAIWHEFSSFMQQMTLHRYEPVIETTSDKAAFSITSLTHLGVRETETFPSISECLQRFYEHKAMRDVVKQKVHDLLRLVTNEKNKNEKKIEKLRHSIEDAHEAERFRLYGELILSHMHQAKKGDTELIATNWYSENAETIVIPLDALKTPSENMQAYYKKYNKAKASLAFIAEQISLAEQEVIYLDGILVQLAHASLVEAEEIREELVEQGYLRNRNRRGSKKKKETAPALDTYYSSDGTALLVGKNNKQNEYLTNKLAASFETWLHTKDIPGSHVVIRSRTVSDQTLYEAAILAAYFSKAQQGSKVPVDYTLIRHVKKPSGAKPGYVTYEQQKTLFVTPDATLVAELKNNSAYEQK
ncbi:Rqc2 family fibronectin-binding protein [Brevibacillus sp. VP]|uniref:Rqc2 family fibronectin-binding protein n=1 Tax=unclassified Brevibacillus TaxID=2684853 RepID=UPI000E2FC302|nr:NFACT RNA binding domain-containing protein [Brevibacillus sp. VP]RFB38047.1 fibronectin/fibrinogen-binding protein [Brevibacillus sp. VP]